MRLVRTSAGLLVVLLLVSTASAQERRTIAVSVVNKQGKFVEDLTAENFRGKFRREPVKILSVGPASGSRRIAVVVDYQSLDLVRNWSLAWQVALHAALALGSFHDMSLFTVEKRLRVESGFMRDAEAFRQKILQAEARIASHSAALRQARGRQQEPELRGTVLVGEDYRRRMEALGARRRAEAEASRRSQKLVHGLRDLILDLARDSSLAWEFGDVVYVVGSAQDFWSSASAGEAKTALARRGLRTFFVWPADYASFLRGLNADGRRFSQELADATGGLWLPLRPGKTKPETIEKRVKPLYELIVNCYKVEIEFPSKIDKPRKWKLEVLNERGKKLRGVQVVYPHLLVPKREPATD